MLSQRLQKKEQKELHKAAAKAAVAMAEYWDVIRGIELRLGREFDGTMQVIETLVSDCDVPASEDQISIDAVMDVVDELLDEEQEEEL